MITVNDKTIVRTDFIVLCRNSTSGMASRPKTFFVVVLNFAILLSCVSFAGGKRFKTHPKGRHVISSHLHSGTLKPIKHDTPSGHSTLPVWGSSAGIPIYQGCFQLNGQPSYERTDSENNNFYCNQFCNDKEKTYSATTGERCLCFEELPSERLHQGKCDLKCPDDDYQEGNLCTGFGCCGSRVNDAVSVFTSGNQSQDRKSSKRTTPNMPVDIQGCFDDTRNAILPSSGHARTRTDSANTALRCAEFCSGKGFAVASLRNDLCICTNDLPLDRLYEGSNGSAQCNMRCAGVFADSTPCSRDECCGGGDDDSPVYTVLVVGNVDVLRQLLSRLYRNLRSDPASHVLREAFDVESICDENWRLFKGTCVRKFHSTKTYQDAKRACEGQGATLLVLRNPDEIYDFTLQKEQPEHNITFYFIGLEFHSDTNTWMWADGEPLTYEITSFDVVLAEQDRASRAQDAQDLSCSVYVDLQSRGEVYYARSEENCRTLRLKYVCQKAIQLSVSAVANKRDSGQVTLTKYTMDMSNRDMIEETTLSGNSDNRLTLSLENLREKIRKQESVNSEHLAAYDVTLPNKNNDNTAQLQFSHQVRTTESTAVTVSGGMSYTVSVGTEFKTSYFGLAEQKITAEFSTTGSWEQGTTTTTAETIVQTYNFQIPVPAGCDATVMVVKEKTPTRIDWRAEFFISGRVELTFRDETRALDISRIATANDRYVYGFGHSDYGERPTIVPKNTLDCEDEEEQTETIGSQRRELEAQPEDS